MEKSTQTHLYESTSDEMTYTTEYEYWPSTGQLRFTYVTVNDDSRVRVSEKYYKQNGAMSSLQLHKRDGVAQSNYMQVVNYRYNARGQLTHINNPSLIVDAFNFENYDVFGQEITYEKESEEYDSNGSEYSVTKQYNGNISSMIWNVKSPEEDGGTLPKHLYIYDYDDTGNLLDAWYASDDPSTPGTFDQNPDYYTVRYGYNLGGNIKSLWRNRGQQYGNFNLDDLTYSYKNDGYKLDRVDESVSGIGSHLNNVKHFVDGASQANEYEYDSGDRMVKDRNRKIDMTYNRLGLPSVITPFGMTGSHQIKYMYDAAGNKLQKYLHKDDCDPLNPGIPCNEPSTTITEYVGNFIYENGELKMIYHPEGVIRPTPPQAENQTEFVFDYFIKDYLGNVRAVITEEDAMYTEKFLATMEAVHAHIEEVNFENIEEVREDLPAGYPVNGSVELNAHIAHLNAANGTEIGPSIVLPVRRGSKVSLSTEYFYTEGASGSSYDNIDNFINEILLAFISGGSGILPLNENQLIEIVSGQWNYGTVLEGIFANEIDTSDVSRPYAYLVWTAYDSQMNIIPEASGVERVSDPNDLQILLREEIEIAQDGYLHAYVSNGSSVSVNFDNFLITTMRGKMRHVQCLLGEVTSPYRHESRLCGGVNHYYPYGLTISGINNNSDEYLNKYTSKELQTGEWNASVSTGLEMYDFHARFYDPQLGRWFAPDPAEQFSNPYLAMGNNPVMYVDPDGEFVVIGAILGAYIGGVLVNDHGNPARWNWDKPAATIGGMAVGAVVGGFGGASLAVAKGKSTTMLGKTMTTAAGNKLFAGTVGGTVNTISNYDGSVGWGTLGDFAAGFGGAYIGVATNSMPAAFNAGGFLNAVNNVAQDGFETPYEFAQDWVGGGLSSMTGAFYGSVGGNFNLFGEKAKFWNKTFNYGLQANAYDFAYTKKDDFLGRKGYEHATIFAASGLSASLFSKAGGPGDFFKDERIRNVIYDRSARVLGTMAVSFFDVGAQRLAKGNYLNYYNSRAMRNKFGISALKSFLYPFR